MSDICCDTEQVAYIYLVKLENGVYKIGRTEQEAGNSIKRLKSYPYCTIVFVINVQVDRATYIESELIALFNTHFECVQGKEYFRGDGNEIKKIALNYIINDTDSMVTEPNESIIPILQKLRHLPPQIKTFDDIVDHIKPSQNSISGYDKDKYVCTNMVEICENSLLLTEDEHELHEIHECIRIMKIATRLTDDAENTGISYTHYINLTNNDKLWRKYSKLAKEEMNRETTQAL